jgi:hypothetical protein
MRSLTLIAAMLSAAFTAVGLDRFEAAAAMQPATRIATTAEGLLGSALFYHGKLVVVQHAVSYEQQVPRLAGTAKPIFVVWKERPSSDRGEIRGEFWDLGRIEAGDSRFAGYDLAQIVESTLQGRWPSRDQVFVLLGATLTPSNPSPAPTLRSIALTPDQYEGREVKVVGRFKGRNLYGEVPQAVGKGKWDFVLQSADGVLWVTGVRPKGKGFDLDPGARVDTGRWLEVKGVVERAGNLVYINASSVEEAKPPSESVAEVMMPERPKLPQPEVIFSAPVADEDGVARTAPVRIQFSRDIDPKTIANVVRVSYVQPPDAPADAPKPPGFTVTYNDAAHAIEIRFAKPLERFQKVQVEVLEGIMSLDGQTVKPWTLTFTTGGQ